MSVYVCLLATANVEVLAQKSSAIVAVQSQGKKGVKAPAGVAAEIERPVEKRASQAIRLSSQNEKFVVAPVATRATLCALLSKYLSLS
jgi:hypothetical protein